MSPWLPKENYGYVTLVHFDDIFPIYYLDCASLDASIELSLVLTPFTYLSLAGLEF